MDVARLATEETSEWRDTSVEVTVGRTAALLRVLWAGGAVLAVAGWTITAGPQPWPSFAALVGVVWALTMAMMVRISGDLGRWVALADGLLFALLLAADAVMVPPDLVGDGTTWVWNGACISVLIACWLLHPRDAAAVGVAMIVAAIVGLIAAHTSGTTPDMMATFALLGAQVFVGVVTVQVIRAAALRAKVSMARREAIEHAEVAETSRIVRQEEQEDLLHDKVQNTLYLLGSGNLVSAPERSRIQAAGAVRALGEVIAGRRRTGSSVELLAELKRIIADLEEQGFATDLHIDQRRTVDSGMPAQVGTLRLLPAVVDALCTSAAQALANARYHAKVTSAAVSVRIRPGRVTVVVSDRGVGFDVSDLPAGAHGVRSIKDKMARVGGTAKVVSRRVDKRTAHNHGTTWYLAWDGSVGSVDEHGSGTRSMNMAREAMVHYGRGFVSMFVVLAVVFHLGCLYPLLYHAESYRSPGLAVACWLAMTFVGAVLIFSIHRSWRSAVLVRSCGVLAVATAVVVAANCQPWALLGFQNWALTTSMWLFIVIGVSGNVREAAAGGAVVLATTATIGLVTLDPVTATVVKLISLMACTTIVLAGALLAARFMRVATRTTADEVWLASSLVAEQEAIEVVRVDRVRMFGRIDARILSLLESVSDGRRHPNDASVQRDCRSANALLRQCSRLKQARAHCLIALLDFAADRDVTIDFPLLGPLDQLPPAMQGMLVAQLQMLLEVAQPGAATVTVQDGVSLWMPTQSVSATDCRPLTTTMQIGIARGEGARLRQHVGAPHQGPISTSIDMYDDDGVGDDAAATLALMRVVIFQ